tara:strand:+ start:274 stop:447 length:174 start_codon:yes stop_codon:yes gene_type:complete
MTIHLTENDLNEQGKQLDPLTINLSNFRVRMELFAMADLVIFTLNNGFVKVIKNRYI